MPEKRGPQFFKEGPSLWPFKAVDQETPVLVFSYEEAEDKLCRPSPHTVTFSPTDTPCRFPSRKKGLLMGF